MVGRFTATDPLPGIIFEPASLHPYTYAYNDPVNKSDPSGKFTLIEQMEIAGAVGTLAGIGYAAENYYYYRSAELAFEAGADAFLSVGSLALDMLGAGSCGSSIAGRSRARSGRSVRLEDNHQPDGAHRRKIGTDHARRISRARALSNKQCEALR